MREYCGINLTTKEFYVGSTTDLDRRLKDHEKTRRLGEGQTYWLTGEGHEDNDREEEQFYLDFYYLLPNCLNRSGNSQLGNGRGITASAIGAERISIALQGNTNGSANKGRVFYYDPETKKSSRFIEGTQPEGWKRGSPNHSVSGYRIWKDSNGRQVRVYPGDDTTGLTPPALKRRDKRSEEFNKSRRKKF